MLFWTRVTKYTERRDYGVVDKAVTTIIRR